MKITENLLDELTIKAKRSERLREAFDLRNSPQDNSQRILNALEPGTFVPVHRHTMSSETVVVIRGSVRQNFYSENGDIIESFVVSSSSMPMYHVPKNAWHNTESLESGTIIFETKDGKYYPTLKEDILNS